MYTPVGADNPLSYFTMAKKCSPTATTDREIESNNGGPSVRGEESRADSARQKAATADDFESRPAAPDGGWGWIVVLGAFVNGLMAAGFTSLISVLYVEWTAYFKISAGEMSWIGFLFPGTAGFVSIVIGVFWSKLGIRGTAIIGALLSSAGCLAGSFSTRPAHIALAIGLVSGVGVGLCYISSINIVAMYFNKRFGLANGIMFLGTSLSQVGVPPLTRLLVAWYGWRGALQISSALMANGVAAACLFRPLIQKPPKRAAEGCNNEGFKSNVDETEDVMQMDVILSTPIGTPVIQRRRLTERSRDSARSDHGAQKEVGLGCKAMYLSPPSFQLDNRSQNARSKSPERASELDRINSLRLQASNSDQCAQETNPDPVTSSGAGSSLDAEVTNEVCNAQKVRKTLADMFGITLFRNEPLSILQNLSSVVVMMGTFPAVAHLMAMAIDSGISHPKAASLLSVLGVGGTVGRLLAGVIADKNIIGPHCFMMLTNVLTAIPIALLPFVITVFSHTAATIFFAGIGIGASIVLRIVQAKKVVSPAFIADAVRIVVMTTGIGMTAGAVLSGWLADITGSYSVSFFFTADILLFGAAINLVLSALTRRRRKKETTDGQLMSADNVESGSVQQTP